MAAIPAIFFLWLIFDLVIAFFATKLLPYSGIFAFVELLKKFQLPDSIKSLANFDGMHYLTIAIYGYRNLQQAFFPLYPLVLGFLLWVFKTTDEQLLIIGVLISIVSFLAGFLVFRRYLFEFLNKKEVFWILFFLLIFPTSFFFHAVYTEGLFFLLVVLFFSTFAKEKYFKAFIFSFLAATTRFIGVFLIIPVLIGIFRQKRNSQNLFKLILVLFAPVLGMATYSFYLLKTTGDPLAFFSAQPLFGAGRSTNLILFPQVYFRYLKIFLTAKDSLQLFRATVEFSAFTLGLGILIWQLYKIIKSRKQIQFLGLNLFSLTNLLVPSLTGTFLSMPRFILLSPAFFIALGQLKTSWLKISIAIVFIVLHVLLLSLFIQGYFVS